MFSKGINRRFIIGFLSFSYLNALLIKGKQVSEKIHIQ